MKVSVVIPVLNAERHLPTLLPALLGQRPQPPGEIVLLDSKSQDRTREIAAQFEGVRVVPVENFSHGGTRNLGAREARGEIVVLMSQDALPQDESWLARLLEPLADARVAASYSRQVPYPDANPMERYFLHTHFPAEPAVRSKDGVDGTLGFQDVFFSNVSAALRRDLLLKFPFDETLIMSEDQQVSRDLLNAGYRVVYQPQSVVIHSHNYSLSVIFKRYFDSVYSLAVIFPQHTMKKSAGMGYHYLRREMLHMFKNHPAWIPYYFCYTLARSAGTFFGHFAEQLPRWLTRRMSMHSYHWQSRADHDSVISRA
jgi:rhamnosyltransferase